MKLLVYHPFKVFVLLHHRVVLFSARMLLNWSRFLYRSYLTVIAARKSRGIEFALEGHSENATVVICEAKKFQLLIISQIFHRSIKL